MTRLTAPCRAATPLRRAASRSPMAMLNRVSPGSSARRPRAISSSKLTWHSAAKLVKYRCMSSTGKRSMPAGTGVCVVKTQPRTVSTASERQALADELAERAPAEEAGVPLVRVEDLRLEARLQGPDAADAEEDLLADAVLGVAAVEPVGHQPAVRGVPVDVAVQEIELHPADIGPPDLGLQGLAGEVDGDADALAPGQRQRRDRALRSAPAACRPR